MKCFCKSGRPRDACHVPLLTETYRSINSDQLLYQLPPHVTRNQSRFYAGRLTTELGYEVDDVGYPKWTLRPRADVIPFRLIPLMRPIAHDPELSAIKGLFRGIERWPTDPPTSPDAREEATRRLVRVSAGWSAEELHTAREAFVSLLRFADPDALDAGLGDLVLAVRTAFPQATIDVLRLDPRTLADPMLIRVLALMPLMEIRDLTHILTAPATDPYRISLFYPESHFELLGNLCFPRVFSFGVRLGPEAYVILDYGQDLLLEAHDWTERRARDVGPSLYAGPGSTVRARPFPSMRPEDRHFLRAWLARRLNFLFTHLCNLHSTSLGGAVDTTPLWKDLATIKDIVALTQIVATSSDPAIIRLVFFDLLDRYVELGGRARKVDDLLSRTFIESLAEAIGDDLLDLQPVVREYLLDSWKGLVDGLWAGVLDPDARDARAINVSPPAAPPVVYSGEDYASRMIRVLRNTTHGYHLHHRAFELYVSRHSGVLPDSVRELAIGLWLALVACPHMFWPADRFSGMHKVILPFPAGLPDE